MKKFLMIVIGLLAFLNLVACSKENGTSHTHSFSRDYVKNGVEHWRECECGEEKNKEKHQFGEWTEVIVPTVTTSGKRERKCKICGYVIEESIPPLEDSKEHEHSFSKEYEKNSEKHWKECSSCGVKKEEAEHKYGIWEDVKDSTEVEDGLRKHKCSICGYEEMEVIHSENQVLGKTINLITASDYKDLKRGVSVLNSEKDYSILKSQSLKKTTTTVKSAYSMNELIVDLSASLSIGIGIEGGYNGFFCEIFDAFSSQNSLNYKNFNNQFYCIYSIVAEKDIYYIKDYNIDGIFDDFFTDDFLKALDNLKKNENYYDFFNKYGSHLIASVIYGGKNDLYYSVVSNNNSLNLSNKTTIENCVKAGVEGLASGSATISSSISSSIGISMEEMESALYSKALGGNTFVCTDFSDYKTHLTEWSKAIDENKLNSVFINYAEDGLIPLWDILPAKYADLSDIMRTKFIEYYSKGINDKLDKFSSLGDISRFAGGKGTEDSPYKISSSKHLLNMKYDLNAHYILMNDIDMIDSAWTPLKTFTGHFDGQGFTISNLTCSLTSGDGNLTRFGFCETNQGTIENVTFNRLTINVKKERDGVSDLSIGAVCGLNAGGVIQGISVKHSSIIGEHYREVGNPGSEVKVQIGGIAGAINDGKISNCFVFDSIVQGKADMGKHDGDAHANVGGIVGELLQTGEIELCVVRGETEKFNTIKGVARGNDDSWEGALLYSRVGSIVGYMGGNTKINYCFEINNNVSSTYENIGKTSLRKKESVSGSIAGRADSGSILNCAYTGDVIKGAGNCNETANQNISGYQKSELMSFFQSYLAHGWHFNENGYPDR